VLNESKRRKVAIGRRRGENENEERVGDEAAHEIEDGKSEIYLLLEVEETTIFF